MNPDQKATDAGLIRAALARGEYFEAYHTYRPSWADRLSTIPAALRPGLVRHVLVGVPTGGFLTAVLENDLMESMARADEGNRQRMFDITTFIYNCTPRLCHGSAAKVTAWQDEGGEMNFTYDHADLKDTP